MTAEFAGPTDEPVHVASCTGQSEPDGIPCLGTLRFGPDDIQAACDTCGGWCGWMVADYEPGQPRLSCAGNILAPARREQHRAALAEAPTSQAPTSTPAAPAASKDAP